MRSFVGIIIIILFVACTRNKSVQVSGRVETGDTVVYFQVNDSLHKFRLDEKHYFSGKIELEKGTYARFIPYSIQVFLTPGEDLEISMNNVRNVSNSLQFKGTLSAINLYLKEQQNRYFIYDPNLYKLNEKDFVNRMRENINTNIVLLEAKNLGEEFTKQERERIRYRVAEQAIHYPRSHVAFDTLYKPGMLYDNFVSEFDINNEEMLAFDCYQRFVLNYIYYKGQNFSMRRLVNYIRSNVNSVKVRDYLLSEVVYNYFQENGLKDADYLLAVCWNEVSDTSKMVKIKQLVDRWRKLSPGATAPNISLQDSNGKALYLKDLRGKFLYISVWASGYGEIDKEVQAEWKKLVEEYKDKNILFATFCMGSSQWLGQVKNLPGEHYVVNNTYAFYSRYMVTVMPRYMLIDPEGRIVDVDAPKPSSSAKLLLRSVGL
ncbi:MULTISPECIES: TlpA family protein disulfide reductase [Butyricimonas]|jgi:thioredoxin|uniref:Redoxin family protein n=1 Tax=Butyricimonas virosa TaxID=544645 RepID=A0A413IN32_9BACT|nr:MULTISPECIES: redoxin family protein [Butyricimonas]MBS5626225.1 redoxin family protein [Porphyromonadaceae bacterium]MBR5460965.1 redoxin family protein [Butyricimonas sp.]MCI7161803.1 redoxin family protein [Butyricimonas virosa]MCI7293037.1 redoxin family protein [Butyricimonas virosa]MDY5013792.1 redoxin family protein [Butyricimonas virosa]